MHAWYLVPGAAGLAAELREVPTPEPAPGQILVRVRAAGLNRGELFGAEGPVKPGGNEGAGEVAKLGAAVSGVRTGERVMGRCAGAFAEYELMDGWRVRFVITTQYKKNGSSYIFLPKKARAQADMRALVFSQGMVRFYTCESGGIWQTHWI